MTKILHGLVVGVVIALTACSNPAPKPQPAAENPDATLKKTLSAYVVEFLRRNPTTNTYLGGAGLDPSLKRSRRDAARLFGDGARGRRPMADRHAEGRSRPSIRQAVGQRADRPRGRAGADPVHAAPAPGAQVSGTRARHVRQRSIPRDRLAAAGDDPDRRQSLRHGGGMDLVDQPGACHPPVPGHGAGAARNRTEGQPHPGSADAVARRSEYERGKRQILC